MGSKSRSDRAPDGSGSGDLQGGPRWGCPQGARYCHFVSTKRPARAGRGSTERANYSIALRPHPHIGGITDDACAKASHPFPPSRAPWSSGSSPPLPRPHAWRRLRGRPVAAPVLGAGVEAPVVIVVTEIPRLARLDERPTAPWRWRDAVAGTGEMPGRHRGRHAAYIASHSRHARARLPRAGIPCKRSKTPHVCGVCSISSMYSLKAHTGFEPVPPP
jgi:hypothetical protein